MKKKLLVFCLLIALLIFSVFIYWNIRKQQIQQKAALTPYIHQVFKVLIPEILQARENTILEVPVNGQWQDHIIFIRNQGCWKYIVKDGSLLQIHNGKAVRMAGSVVDLRFRRQRESPGVLEVQVQVRKDVSLVSHLKIRISS